MNAERGVVSGLNHQQSAAVTAPTERPLLVLAGAGCGKTTVLVRRIAFLLESGIPAPAILGLTFTRKAADEMARRVAETCSVAPDSRPLITTFHGLGYRVLRERLDGRPNFERLGYTSAPRIATDGERLRMLANHTSLQEREVIGMDLLRLDALLSCHAVHPGRLTSLRPEQRQVLDTLAQRMCTARIRDGLCDFSDLIGSALALLRSEEDLAVRYVQRFTVILVDEFQDTNPLQVEMLHRLCGPKTHVFAVGDDDQAIYGFRGADTGPILDFSSHFPGARIIKLEVNYRSTTAILSCANRIFRTKPQVYRKILRSGHPNIGRGAQPLKRRFASQDALYEWISSRLTMDCQEEGISIGDTALLFRLNDTREHAKRYWEYAFRGHVHPHFLTVHSAKGLEFPIVFLCDLEEGVLPNYRLRGSVRRSGPAQWARMLLMPGRRGLMIDCDIAEEQRLFYVGVTRAQKRLYLLSCASKKTRGTTHRFVPSRFLRLV